MGLWYYLHLFSWCVPSHRLMVKKITYKYSGLGSSSRIPLVPSNHPDFSQWLHLVHGLSHRWKVNGLHYLQFNPIENRIMDATYAILNLTKYINIWPVQFIYCTLLISLKQFVHYHSACNFLSKVHLCGPSSPLAAILLQRNLYRSRPRSLHCLECAQVIADKKH